MRIGRFKSGFDQNTVENNVSIISNIYAENGAKFINKLIDKNSETSHMLDKLT
jgi:hypothetical protein